MPILSIAANSITLINAGAISSNKLAMVTLPSKNIIKVVTSPVINDTPPELTPNTISVAYFISFLGGSFNDITTASDINVAVTLSETDENKKANTPTKNISLRSLILVGITLCTIFSINPFEFK